MNKVRYLTKKVFIASIFLSSKSAFCKMFLYFFVAIVAFSSSFALNYNEVPKQKNNQKVEEFFNLINKFEPVMESKINLSTPEGALIGLKDYRGKLVIVFFWATWCNTCVQQLGELQKLKEEILYRERTDIDILAINVDFKAWDKVVQTSPINKAKNLIFLLDVKKQLMGEMGVTALPTSFLIDPNGYVILRNEAKVQWDSPDMLAKIIELRDSYYNNKEISVKKENDSLNDSGIIRQNEQKKQPIIIN